MNTDEDTLRQVLDRCADPVDSIAEPLLKFFRCDLDATGTEARVRRAYAELACALILTCPKSAERTVALRKAIESKDASLRSLES